MLMFGAIARNQGLTKDDGNNPIELKASSIGARREKTK